MITRLLFTILCASTIQLAISQKNVIRTIEVTGASERLVEPDEIIFSITIEEYWKEEFEGKKWEDYKTKIDIEVIENNLVKELDALGVALDQITLKNTGNYWRQRGKDFLINKQLQLKLQSFKEVNALANAIRTRGVKSMMVSKMNHKKLDKYALEVKKEALKKAEEKARYLVESMGKELGAAVSIIEIDKNAGIVPMVTGMARSDNMAMMEASAVAVEYENFRQIKLHSEMRVVFEIGD